MRIISGKFKGRRLAAFQGKHIRPTTDRVKETIFNKLQPYIVGARVLDLYSGTGNLAIEALSRGAEEVIAVENHSKSIAIIRKNLEALDISEGIRVVNKDVLRFLKDDHAGNQGFDIVLIDPPFTKKLADETMKKLADSKLFCPQTQVVVESSGHELINDEYPGLILLDRKDFGDKRVSFFEKDSES